MLLRRRSRRAAAVVGLLAGLALLLGAVLDGGMASPTRVEGPDGVAAVPHSDLGTAQAPGPREDHPTWGPTALGTALWMAGLAALALRWATTPTLVAGPAATGPRHRAPALRVARHRGPPAVV